MLSVKIFIRDIGDINSRDLSDQSYGMQYIS